MQSTYQIFNSNQTNKSERISMRKLFFVGLLCAAMMSSCKKSQTTSINNSENAFYLGTYYGTDYVEIYDQGNLIATQNMQHSLEVVSSGQQDKNVYLLHFMGHDSVKAHFYIGRLSIQDMSSPVLSNFNGSFDTHGLTYQFEIVDSLTYKFLGVYSK